MTTSMDNFEFCVRIVRREQNRFNVVSDASIPKEITASSANDMNYDIVYNRCAYLFRCGAGFMSFISNALNNFIMDNNEIASLIMKWNSSSNLTFCSLSKGPALDYLSFLIALKKYVPATFLFHTVYVIAKHGAWRNTIRSMEEVVTVSPLEALKGVSLWENIMVIQGDPMSKFTEKFIPAISESDVLFMVKSVKDDLDDIKFNFMLLFSCMKVGALFFCIETKPITKKLVDILSLLPGEMLYGPTEVTAQLGFDCQEEYKTEFGCGPTQSARGVFFVWEKKPNIVSTCELKDKAVNPVLSFVNSAKNIIQRQSQAGGNVEFQNNSPICDNLGQISVLGNAALPLHSETINLSFDSPFKRDQTESLIKETLPTLPVSTQANMLKSDSDKEKAADSADSDKEKAADSATSKSDIKTSDVTLKEKDDCDKKGNTTPCLQISEQSESSSLTGDTLVSCPESEFETKTTLPTQVKKQLIEINTGIRKASTPLTINEVSFSQKTSPIFIDYKTKSEDVDFLDSSSSVSSLSKNGMELGDGTIHLSPNLNNSSKRNDGLTCDNIVNLIHSGSKSVSNYYSNENTQEDVCQPHQSMADKISDLANQINQLTLSMMKSMTASPLKPCPNEHSCQKKSYNYCCNACGHESRHANNKCNAHGSACQGRCLRNTHHCLPASSHHVCSKNKSCNMYPSVNYDCQERSNIKSCCLPACPHHGCLKSELSNSGSCADFDSSCSSACSIPSCLKSKCCKSYSGGNFGCQEHININARSNTNLNCQEHTKTNSNHVQKPKLVIPLNGLPEEALFSILKPMCSKLKKD